MNKTLTQCGFAMSVVLCIAIQAISPSDVSPAQGVTTTAAAAGPAGQATPQAGTATSSPPSAPGSTGASQPTAAQQLKPLHITQLFSSWGAINGLDGHGKAATGSVGLNEELRLKVAAADETEIPQLDGRVYALFVDGQEVKGLPDPLYDTRQHSLVFQLKRNDRNKDLWNALLGSPTGLSVPVIVSLGERPTDPKESARSTISARNGSDSLDFEVLPPARLAIAVLIIAGFLALLWIQATRNATLRDNLLPQLDPQSQPFSLARWQMAFWFTLVFVSFTLLFLLLWDTNTISPQALVLMGISGATALAAVAVDVAKNSPADNVNRALQALGLNNHDDVLRVQAEIATRQEELAALPLPAPLPQPPGAGAAAVGAGGAAAGAGAPVAAAAPVLSQIEQRRKQLQTEIQDREDILRLYEDKTRPFKTQGWFNDLTSDLNGTAIHRLQAFCWTWVLGGIFVYGVWRDLAMPEFNKTLLTLLGISSAGYVGFKIPEANN